MMLKKKNKMCIGLLYKTWKTLKFRGPVQTASRLILPRLRINSIARRGNNRNRRKQHRVYILQHLTVCVVYWCFACIIFTFFRHCLSPCRDPDRVISIRSSDVLSWRGKRGQDIWTTIANFAASILPTLCLKS